MVLRDEIGVMAGRLFSLVASELYFEGEGERGRLVVEWTRSLGLAGGGDLAFSSFELVTRVERRDGERVRSLGGLRRITSSEEEL